MADLENHAVFVKTNMEADRSIIKCRLDNVNDLYKRFETSRQAIEDEAPVADVQTHQKKANDFLELFYVTKAALISALSVPERREDFAIGS